MIPKHLERWTRPDHYMGASWPDYFSAGVGQSRDSQAWERSNFRVMLAALGGESETVLVIRESDWAVGWVEWIAIHESDAKALGVADAQAQRLADYPVLDEMDCSELENEDAQEVWANCYDNADRLAYIREHRSQFDFRSLSDLLGCVRGHYFSGYASDLLT